MTQIAQLSTPATSAPGWLPAGKTAAICFSIDDVHPGTSECRYEAGGDLDDGALGRLLRLQQRHPRLKATLCVTPEWQLDSLVPNKLVRHVPWLNRHVHWTRRQPGGRFRLDRHPQLVEFLNRQERCEVVLHGLHHAHVGPRFAVEFQHQTVDQCIAMLQQGLKIFHAAGLRFVRGFTPPAWNAPPALITALEHSGFFFLCSARDLRTPVLADAVTNMSGLKGVSLIHPQRIGGSGLVHLTCNFQATSSPERAVAILEAGGLLHIKAHVFKSGGGHMMLDGLDDLYCHYLDLLLGQLDRQFGSRLWWAHLSEVAQRMRAAA